MLTRAELINDIRRGLATLEYYIRPGGPVNLTDENVHAEPFVAGVLNSVYGWNLSSTNDKKANYPCIDLIDESLRLGVQVTSEKGSKKVNKTIECLEEHKLAGKVQELKMFSLVSKQDRYTVTAVCPGIKFTWTEDVLDFDDVVQKTVAITDLQHLTRVREYVVASMQSIFSRAAVSALPTGIEATYPHLLTQIRSGNGDNVRRLLQAGLSPNIDWNGERPLRVALALLDHSPSSRIADYRAVVASLVQAADPPRELAKEAHDAFDNGQSARLVALLMAGLPLDVRSDTGTTLLAKAMRRDDELLDTSPATSRASEGSVALMLRHGKRTTTELGGWALRWASRRGHLDLAKQLADTVGVGPLTDALPDETLTNAEAQFWKRGVTPLHLAAECQRPVGTRLVESLLKKGADAKLQDGDGNTPLMVAVAERSVESARLLAAHPQQDFDIVNKSGKSALSLAVGKSELVQILLQAGAKVPNERHHSPLHVAAYGFDADSLALLLASSADPNIVNEEGRTPLLEMCCFGYHSILDLQKPARSRCLTLLLNGGADVRAADTSARTALHWLAATDEVAALREVLKQNPDVNAADQIGRTPLMSCSNPQMVDALLEHGADLEASDKRGYTALAWATMFDRDEVAERLKAANAKTDNLTNADLIHACRNGDVPHLAQLLNAGADPNCTDGWGRPALELAGIHGHVEAVVTLLDCGATVDVRDDRGATPLANVLWTDPHLMKTDMDSLKAVSLKLLDRGATLDSVDYRGNSAAHVGFWWWLYPEMVERLRNDCFDKVNHEHTTLLMTALERGSYEDVRYLIDHKRADINQLDRQGQNVLFHLSGYRTDSLAKARLLLDAGADLECSDVDGRTPLLRAAAGGYAELVRMFVHYGAKLDHQDHSGRTARHLALQIPNVEIANLLWECERNPDMRRMPLP